MTLKQRALIVPIAIRRARNSILTMRAAADVDPVFRRWYDDGLQEKLERAASWLAQAHLTRST